MNISLKSVLNIAFCVAVICNFAAGSACATMANGVSNAFTIDNNRAAPTAVSAEAKCMHTTYSAQLRGQLHAQISPDAGSSITSLQLAQKYQSLGYDFLAQTDFHYRVNPVSGQMPDWAGWAANSVELKYGSSDTSGTVANDGSVLAIGMNDGTDVAMLDFPTAYTGGTAVAESKYVPELDATANVATNVDVAAGMSGRIANIRARAGFAFAATPDKWPTAVSVRDLIGLQRSAPLDGIEVWTPSGGALAKWDRTLYSLGETLSGIAGDDFSPEGNNALNAGKSWISVPAMPDSGWKNIVGSIREGDYYICYMERGVWPSEKTVPGVQFSAINASGAQPIIRAYITGIEGDAQARPTPKIEFGGYGFLKNGVFRSQEVTDGPYTYQATGHEKFVRVAITIPYSFGTLKILSQPIFVNRAGSVGGQSGLDATYLDLESRPKPPAGGYIGPVCNVENVYGGARLSLGFEGEEVSSVGVAKYLSIYKFDYPNAGWVKIDSEVDFGRSLIEADITQAGVYCISADIPDDEESPTVKIMNLKSGASITEDTQVIASAGDDIGVWRVRFYMNGKLICEDTDPLDLWNATIKADNYISGSWTLKALAEDLAGKTSAATVTLNLTSDATPPSVEITSPAADAEITGIAEISGTCSLDPAAESVSVFVDDVKKGDAAIDGGSWTYSLDTSSFADGIRTIKAAAYDAFGNSAEDTVSVRIVNASTSSSIGAVKETADGSHVKASGIVTVGTARLGDGFYMESADRSAGIKVKTQISASEGDAATIIGTKTTTGGEPAIESESISIDSSDNSLPAPLFIYAKNIIGMKPDSIGKVVKMMGVLNAIDESDPPKCFTISDALGAKVLCLIPDGISIGDSWSYLTVTGVGSFVLNGSERQPALYVAGQSSIQQLIGVGVISGNVTTSGTTSAIIVAESAHNYANNFNYTWTLPGPANATKMRIHFTKIELEKNSDYLYLKDSSGVTKQTYNSYPAVTNVWSDWIDGNAIKMNLVTDSTVTYYGFKADQYEAITPAGPFEGVTLTLSPGGQTTSTNSEGVFTFKKLLDGAYTITPSKSGYTFSPTSLSITVENGQVYEGNDFAAQ